MKASGAGKIKKMFSGRRWSAGGETLFSLIMCISLALSLFAAPGTALAAGNPAPVQIFYVTLPEADGLSVLSAINSAAVNPMYTYFSIAIGVDGAYVYYDQWENGYAVDIANPTPAEIYSASKLDGVQIWGNGLAADGCAPNILGVPVVCTDANDVLHAGDVIIPYNAVPVPRVIAPQWYVLDTFSVRAYTNNDGNKNWSTNWVETGDDGSATSGQISIETQYFPTQLRFTATDANDSIDRGVDLSTGGSCAMLSFDLGQSGIDNTGDNFAVQVSKDGTTYTTLDTYTSASAAGAKSYSLAANASATTRVRFLSVDKLESGEYWSIDNARVDWNCYLPVLFDGKDKVGASSSISMARATWASGSGTLNAFGHEMYPSAEWGLAYEAPVGTNTANAGQMFEYSGLSIMASQNNTTVQIDKDANGSYETTVTLQEGGATLVSGILQGARVQSDKPVQVLLVTGDIGSSYASRDMMLLPVSAFGPSYWSPVGENKNTSYPARLFLYNPSANGSIYITCELYGAANVTQGPVLARGVVTQDLISGQGAHCFASTSGGVATSDPISAIGTVDTTNTAYDWSFTLYPDNFLSTDALVGLGLGRDPTSSTNPTENANPLWVTAACQTGGTYVYVDWNNDGTADPVDTNGDGTAEAGSQNGILVNRLQSVRLFKPSSGRNDPYDQSGARVWSRTASGVGKGGDPGCLLALAWGADPQWATAGAPGLDVGTSIPPLRLIEGTKTLTYANDIEPTGVLNPGDTIYYNITVKNSGTTVVNNVRVYDTAPAHTTYVAGTTEWGVTNGYGTPIADAPNPGDLPLSQVGGVLLGNLAVGQTFYVRFQVTLNSLAGGDYEDITNCDNVYTNAGNFTRCVTTPVATRDWGDLPDTYGTTAAANGPRHSYNGLVLGALWDVEEQGQTSVAADGDDLTTSDDEDGVAKLGTTEQWRLGNGSFRVTVSGGSGCLNAWMDFTNDAGATPPGYSDGNFTKASGGYDTTVVGGFSEHIIQNASVSTGVYTITVTVPPNLNLADDVDYYFRFRLTPKDVTGGCTDPTPYGFKAGGEVEDYRFNLGIPTLVKLASFTATGEDQAVRLAWETTVEYENLGFNLYRAETPEGERIQLNSQLIPGAPGSGDGASYEFMDATATAGKTYFYWLEDVDIYGKKELHGPVSAAVGNITVSQQTIFLPIIRSIH